MAGDFTFAVTGRGAGHHLNDQGTAWPIGLDVLRRLFGLELPPGLTPVPLLDIRCIESDLALSLELAADLAVQGLLVGFNG